MTKQQRTVNLAAGGAAAVLSVLFSAFASEGASSGVPSLPLAWIGRGLRGLSLSGTAGNTAAIVLYVLVSLVPLLFLLRGKRHKEDVLLPLASAVTLYSLYYIINPGLRPMVLTGSVGTLVCEGAVYSILLCWAVIRLIRYCEGTASGNMLRLLRILLVCCAFVCICTGFGGGYASMTETMETVREGNNVPGINLTPDFALAWIRYGAYAAEYALTAWILLLSADLVCEIRQDPYSMGCEEAAGETAKWSRITLTAVMLMNTVLNVGQLLAAGELHQLSAGIRIPLLSMLTALLLLMLTGLLRKGRKIKEDNDLFI